MTAVLPVLFAVLAILTAATARARAVRPTTVAVLAGAAAVTLGAVGIGTGTGIDLTVTQLVGVLLAAPLMVVVVALLRGPRAGGRARAARRWTAIVLTTVSVAVALPYLALYVSIFAAHLLFALAGGSYPADGFSLLPGAVLVIAPVAAAISDRLLRPDRRPEPGPASGHLPQPSAAS